MKDLIGLQVTIFRYKKPGKIDNGVKAARLTVSEGKVWKNYEGSDRLCLQWGLGKGNRIIPDMEGSWTGWQLRSSFVHCSPAAFILEMVHRISPNHYSAASPDCGLVTGSKECSLVSSLLSACSNCSHTRSNKPYQTNFMIEVRPAFSPISCLESFGSNRKVLPICTVKWCIELKNMLSKRAMYIAAKVPIMCET